MNMFLQYITLFLSYHELVFYCLLERFFIDAILFKICLY